MAEKFDKIDEQMLGSFVDGHLDPENSEIIIKAMHDDPEIRERVYKLRRARDLMRLGFGGASAPSEKGRTPLFWSKYTSVIAASIAFLTVGLLAAGAGYYYSNQAAVHSGSVIAAAARQPIDKIILHISESDPRQFVAALEYTDQFLQERGSGDHQIDVVAHAGGLDLMRADVSPLKNRIIALMEEHPNVHFIACAGAIRMLQQKNGVRPVIIDGVGTDMTAFDHIVGRLQSGSWKYIKVQSLIGI